MDLITIITVIFNVTFVIAILFIIYKFGKQLIKQFVIEALREFESEQEQKDIQRAMFRAKAPIEKSYYESVEDSGIL